MRTVPSLPEWRDAVLGAYKTLRGEGEDLSDAALSVLWAQFALETGRGNYCWNWNLGNIKWSPGRDYSILRTYEIVDGKRVDLDDRFRAFESIDQGALDYLSFLLRASYAKAWEAVLSGDPSRFAHVLKTLGYYTENEEVYRRNVASLAAEFLRKVPPRVVEAPQAPTREPGLVLGEETARVPLVDAAQAFEHEGDDLTLVEEMNLCLDEGRLPLGLCSGTCGDPS